MKDFLTSLNKTATLTKLQRPFSALPKVWIGFIIAGVFLLVELIALASGYDMDDLLLYLLAIGLVGTVYWLFCVHRFHKILREMNRSYQISPGAAVGYHFIPFYNFYWIFKWPIEFSKYINAQGSVKMVQGGLLGALLLIALLINRFFDGAVGMTFIFGIGTYMANILRRQIQSPISVMPEEIQAEVKETGVWATQKVDQIKSLSWNVRPVLDGLVSVDCPECKEKKSFKVESFRPFSSERPEGLVLTEDVVNFVTGGNRFLSGALGFVFAAIIIVILEMALQVRRHNFFFTVIGVIIWKFIQSMLEGVFNKQIPVWTYTCSGCEEKLFIASDGSDVLLGEAKEKKEAAAKSESKIIAEPVAEDKPLPSMDLSPVPAVSSLIQESEHPDVLADSVPTSFTETLVAPSKNLDAGSVFAGRYLILEELGKGGMGSVYKAFDKEVGEKIALKTIKPEIAADEKVIQRFRNELKIARKISHKNVCRMFDLGREDDTYYIAMEYVSGEDLKSSVRRMGPLSTGKVLGFATEICEGLAEAHRLGIVHRDLKPQNIMIDRDGIAQIMDFGIARSRELKGMTENGSTIGTPEYMSPEQVEGEDIDQRSDIYSMGVILYEMVTGRTPFEGKTPMSIAMKHVTEKPKEPIGLNMQISEDLSRVIMKCMEKDKARRYQSALDLLYALKEIERGIPAIERIKPARKPVTSREITVSFSVRRFLIPVAAVLGVVIIGGGIWFFVLRPESSKPALSSPVPTKEATLAAAHESLKDKDYSGALDQFNRVLELDPEDLDVRFNIATILKELGKTDKALQEFERVIALDEEDPRSYKQLGELFEQRQDLEKGVFYYKKYLSLMSADESEDIDEIVKRVADLEGMLKPAGRAEVQSGTTEKSAVIRDVTPRRAESREPEVDLSRRLDTGIRAFNQERYDQSISVMREILRLDPSNSQATSYLTRAQQEKAKQLKRQEIGQGISLAQVAYERGDYEECLNQVKKVLRLDPENEEANRYYNLAEQVVAPEKMRIIVNEYVQSLNNKELVSFYENTCSSALFQRIKGDSELISNLYKSFRSVASNIKIQLKENNRAEVSFSNIITGILESGEQRQVVFEGTYVWEMEKQGETWKIIGISTQPAGKDR
ncbi:MAG TPA: protein kinase [Candidatus Heimdallarchaeota archaeon]|nr:protein kinase [Candidatus Heimdallarchaeota archaeon]